MKATSVFDYFEYKAFIRAWIQTRPGRGRGEKTKIAAALHCHSAYVSQVLEKDAHFSLEQVREFASYAGLSSAEIRFLLLLLQRDRAGTKVLKKEFDAQIEEALEARSLLRNRMEKSRTLGAEEQATYYSSWLYAATHVGISLPKLQTRERLADWLGISPARTGEILGFLVGAGLVIEEGGRFRPGTASLYLPENSPLISKHHANWRMRALASLDNPEASDLHYSSVATVNASDLPKVRAILVKAIEEVRGVIKGSNEEDAAFCYSLDAFKLS